MRGADTSNSIYIDGIRDIGSVSRDTFNTEQVEVIKGPSGTDYGRSAPTGSINIRTMKPMVFMWMAQYAAIHKTAGCALTFLPRCF